MIIIIKGVIQKKVLVAMDYQIITIIIINGENDQDRPQASDFPSLS